MKKLLGGLLVVAACGGPAAPVPNPTYIPGFNPTPAAAGFTRYVSPIVTVDPGQSELFCQWVTNPFPNDIDVISVTGQQSAFGHHVVVYATTATAPLGTSRLCSTNDMEAVHYIGAIGGDGGGSNINSILPAGAVFRIPAGQSLMFNTHFINTTDQAVLGQAVMDLQFATPSSSDVLPGFFYNNNASFSLAPVASAQTADATCPITTDMSFYALANHMHYLGQSIYTEVIHPDGSHETIVQNPSWLPEYMFNPVWQTWPASQPFALHAGDTLHTHCEWLNDTGATVTFPVEMCDAVGFFVPSNGAQVGCTDGVWDH